MQPEYSLKKIWNIIVKCTSHLPHIQEIESPNLRRGPALLAEVCCGLLESNTAMGCPKICQDPFVHR
jgi:hypothetical protein